MIEKKKKWARALSYEELPAVIVNNRYYSFSSYFFVRAAITEDGRYIGIWFDNGLPDLWYLCDSNNHDSWKCLFTSPDDWIMENSV